MKKLNDIVKKIKEGDISKEQQVKLVLLFNNLSSLKVAKKLGMTNGLLSTVLADVYEEEKKTIAIANGQDITVEKVKQILSNTKSVKDRYNSKMKAHKIFEFFKELGVEL